MRLQPTSVGLDVASLVAGDDLVLDADPTHGSELPAGTLIDDYLTLETRRQIERDAVAATAAWRERHDRSLTVDGICLPFLWEVAIFYRISDLMLKAAGVAGALDAHRPGTLTVVGAGQATSLLIAAVARSRGIELRTEDDAEWRALADPRRVPLPRRARRLAMSPLRRLGIPSRLRPHGILLISYWPLEPLLDRLLSESGTPRPSVLLDKPPAGPRRIVRAAARGGWVGVPGPRDRRAGARLAAEALRRTHAPLEIEVSGAEIGDAVQQAILAHAREQAPLDIAKSRTVRRAFERARPACVVSAWDNHPDARIVITHARAAGVPSFIIAHGAYLQPTVFRDMGVGDEVLLWSEAMERPRPPHGRAHVVGYPVPHHKPPPTRRYEPRESPARIAVIAQPTLGFPLLDGRIEMRQYLTAIDAVFERAPEATIVLRPHPERGRAAAAKALALRPAARIEVDASSPVLELLQGCDLCIGTASAASLQAALVGTPVIVLNMSGYDWLWPLGGETSVPLAHSPDALADWLSRWLAGEAIPGRSDLVAGLGADGKDASVRILAVLAERIPAYASGTSAPGPHPFDT